MPRDQRPIIDTRDHTAFREFDVGKQLDQDLYSEPLHQKDHTAMTKKRLVAMSTGRSTPVHGRESNSPEWPFNERMTDRSPAPTTAADTADAIIARMASNTAPSLGRKKFRLSG